MVFLLLILVYISVCILWNIVFKSTLKLRLASVITAAVLAFGLFPAGRRGSMFVLRLVAACRRWIYDLRPRGFVGFYFF